MYLSMHLEKATVKKLYKGRKNIFCANESPPKFNFRLHHYKLFYLITMADGYFSINNKQFNL